jgi:nucleoside-diphosphate-sugar epimerase
VNKTLLVAGAGYLGEAALSVARSLGLRTVALTRSQAKAARLRSLGTEVVTADLSAPATLPKFSGIHYALVCPAPDRRDESAYREVYLSGVANLLEHLDPQGLEHLLYTSSTSVYGAGQKGWLDETIQPAPDDGKGIILLDAETQVMQSGLPASIFRLAGLYGPGRNRVESKRPSPEATARDRFVSLIHRDDASCASIFLLMNARPGSLFVGVDAEPVLRSELVRWLNRQGAGLTDTFLPSLPGDMPRRFRSGLPALGFQFTYPTYREGYGEVFRRLAAPGEARHV